MNLACPAVMYEIANSYHCLDDLEMIKICKRLKNLAKKF